MGSLREFAAGRRNLASTREEVSKREMEVASGMAELLMSATEPVAAAAPAPPPRPEPADPQPAPRRAGLAPEDEAWLWANYDYKARARIIEAYQPLVFHIYGKLGLRLGEEAVDVISEGTVGLIHAVDNFDPHRGVPFKSYAYLRVKGSMIDYLRSQKIGLKGGELREFEFFSGLASEGEDRISLERLEFLFESLKHLSPREAEIIMGIYHDGLSQSELAERFKCTRANVSILHGRALKRLKHLVFDAQRDSAGAGLAWFNPWA